ncbi:hypothetical protein IFM89_015981 [Coptis chinensis]|uniref:DUF1421 domain-containing protein n=1 Tax=Coptis chinensis TaxID=261450 RepID=A0A835HT79_9MAGN|nr:hypothetical protein IFM89_015981 [Coptis chinensis]
MDENYTLKMNEERKKASQKNMERGITIYGAQVMSGYETDIVGYVDQPSPLAVDDSAAVQGRQRQEEQDSLFGNTRLQKGEGSSHGASKREGHGTGKEGKQGPKKRDVGGQAAFMTKTTGRKEVIFQGDQGFEFMDKQIMDLSRSQTNDDSSIFDLFNPPQEEDEQHRKKNTKDDVILPSYDFQPIRPVISHSSAGNLEVGNNNTTVGTGTTPTRVWNSADNSRSVQNHGYRDPDEAANFTQERDHNAYDATLLSEIDRTMKKHADILLHSLEGVSARLSQMETRTRNLESLVDDLKVSVENDHGSTDGKLRQLENILREVQTGVQVLRDKQEIAEAHLHLSKMRASKGDQQPETQNTVHSDSIQHTASAPQQSQQVHLPQVVPPQPPQQFPGPIPSSGHPPPTQQNQPPVQLSVQVPQSQIPQSSQREYCFPPPGHLTEGSHQQYQLPPAQKLQSPVQPQQYQSTQFPQYSQSSQPPQQHPPVAPVNQSTHQLQPPLGHPPDETPYMLPQSYLPGVRQSSVTQPPSGVPPSQQYYGSPVQMYEPPVNRPNTGFSPGYAPSSGTNLGDSYSYSGPPLHFSSSTMKQPQLPSSPSAPSGGSYPHLPTAQILPHALPTASNVGGGSNSSGTGNRVPIDDVVDKVSTMGFSREQVRATVRKLTENGQSVDLNVVLDKLMNDGEVQQPPKGWFAR